MIYLDAKVSDGAFDFCVAEHAIGQLCRRSRESNVVANLPNTNDIFG